MSRLASPRGREENIRQQRKLTEKHKIPNTPKTVPVIGASRDSGLVNRIPLAHDRGANIIGFF
jgi:trans-2-enoyl-CoA reductase